MTTNNMKYNEYQTDNAKITSELTNLTNTILFLTAQIFFEFNTPIPDNLKI
jgi:hypothetical protein